MQTVANVLHAESAQQEQEFERIIFQATGVEASGQACFQAVHGNSATS
jgi:hypothetical protein